MHGSLIIEDILEDGINATKPTDQEGEFMSQLSDTDKKILDAYGYKKFTDFMNEPEPKNEAWYPIWSYINSLSADDPASISNSKNG